MTPTEAVLDFMQRATVAELEGWLEETERQIASLHEFANQVRIALAERRLTEWEARNG